MAEHDPALVERIANKLYTELDEHDYEDDDEKRGQVAWHFARAVLDAIIEDREIVELPDVMVDRDGVAQVLRSLPMWQVDGDAWAVLREPDLIEFEADGQQVYGEVDVSSARALAATLLAAARVAEAVPGE